MNASNISYIYGLSSSNNKEQIRYIGYSNDPKRRLGEHLYKSKKETTKVYRWIKSHKEKGDKIILNILGCFNETEIYKKETDFILLYKSFGADLLNHNNGGLGGISPDAETRKKISNFHKGNTWGKNQVWTKERRKETSKLFKRINKIKTQKQKDNVSKSLKDCWSNKEWRNNQRIKISNSKKGRAQPNRLFTEEQILKFYKLHSEGKGLKEIIKLEKVSQTQLNNLFYNSKRYSDIKKKHNLVLTKQKIKLND